MSFEWKVSLVVLGVKNGSLSAVYTKMESIVAKEYEIYTSLEITSDVVNVPT
jgi:hypothetical protein